MSESEIRDVMIEPEVTESAREGEGEGEIEIEID